MMRRRWLIAVVVAVVVLAAGASGVLAYDSSRHNVIAKGITVGGVDVGGLTAAQARTRVDAALHGRMRRPIVARFHAHRFVLTPRAAHFAVLTEPAIEEALRRSREGTIFSRVWRGLTGGSIDAQIEPRAVYSRAAVARLVRRAAAALDHPVRNASISYSAASVAVVSDQTGLRVRTRALAGAMRHALSDPAASREVRIPAEVLRPAVTTGQLAAKYPTFITVDRSSFELRLWKQLKLVRTYPIAVGMAGLETPAGLYHVQDKQVNPSWFVPNSAWAGSLAGKIIPPGPQDPIKARWMGIFNGAGIHGIDPSEYGTIGHDASHGCIRMTIPDVIDLYDQTPVGTPVFIA